MWQAQRIGHGCPLPCLLHGSAENRSRKGFTFVVVLALPGQNKSTEPNRFARDACFGQRTLMLTPLGGHLISASFESKHCISLGNAEMARTPRNTVSRLATVMFFTGKIPSCSLRLAFGASLSKLRRDAFD